MRIAAGSNTTGQNSEENQTRGSGAGNVRKNKFTTIKARSNLIVSLVFWGSYEIVILFLTTISRPVIILSSNGGAGSFFQCIETSAKVF